ncbi:Acyl-CoA synthetase (AMP-forming)/AMP-acid ligase II [Bosea sp. 62]|uniref:AMP-binding protein n=1 Tax=unclassified Bosea (in: a-proteobacteria) TaxID=2653178 RepID=UPI0012533C02|nr:MULTISPECIES: AMP-binding protein [unclassified Bosea (in: a-proteobacteria)]CAD5256691.1 Acyl-CoA synthetase (AMP-forming)/AMP-acid ligase II [Bosea sp. 46]CAD5261031.1 Acyl-CoA synthetase (AMP-forming)/AMP-acid ligase II [Bosea sp. 21B]CAD5279598.1 Acyl-CoA synthetase (AMP-forming)/AMP-acid ligase II [Bosea sp. 7B]VVT58383.1 Acyl-CoA synthetase (AMP-forming)/AMP-acid ligase II [Bosea sp. EC-HK365B]VXB52449.1 Acyl-CoA synthetase (AMP-forming)/AMP-acid ligase II [Bosea sp. 29B]
MDVLGRFSSPHDAFQNAALRSPDAPFLVAPASAQLPYARDGFSLAYGAVGMQVEAARVAYVRAGYGRGARVALLLDNRPEFFVHWLALSALGVSIVPINPDLRPEELAYQLTLADVDLGIGTGDRIAPLARAPEFARFRPIELGAPVPDCRKAVTAQAGDLAAECALLFTSGSTGKPKGCILSNRYFLQVAQWYHGQGGIAALRPEGEVNLTPLPMFHMNALGCSAVGMMAQGGAVVPLDRFHASRWWASVADSGATIIHCLGVIPAILLQLPPSPDERRHKVRFAFAPGVDVRHRAAFEERFGIRIVDAWAMTETGGAAATTTAQVPSGFGARCIGQPAAGMEYRIVDDQGGEVAAGQAGELLVRAAGANPRTGFFSSYLDDPAATEEAWQGGWFHTGDFVQTGDDGLLYFFDRKKSIVRRSGENIAVLEVESVLQRQEGVRATAVTPVPDELRGEEVFAFIVADPDDLADRAAFAERIVRESAALIAYHKLPGYLAFVTELPLSATKKLARGEIKQLAAKAVSEGSVIDLRALKAGLRKH